MGSTRAHARRRSTDGFTLTELLVTITILGSLSAVVVLSVRGISTRGEQSACDADRATLVHAAEAHFAQHATYVDEAGLVDAGLLSSESDMHDVTVSGGATAYVIAPTSECEAFAPATTTTAAAATTTTTTAAAQALTSLTGTMSDGFQGRLRNLGNAGAARLYAGPNPGAGGLPNRVETNGSAWVSPGSYQWTVTHDAAANTIVQSLNRIGTGATSTVTYSDVSSGVTSVRPSAPVNAWNVARLSVANRGSATTITVSGIGVTGTGFGGLTVADQNPTAGTTSNVWITGRFDQSFAFTARVDIAGTFSTSQELNKLELTFGVHT